MTKRVTGISRSICTENEIDCCRKTDDAAGLSILYLRDFKVDMSENFKRVIFIIIIIIELR